MSLVIPLPVPFPHPPLFPWKVSSFHPRRVLLCDVQPHFSPICFGSNNHRLETLLIIPQLHGTELPAWAMSLLGCGPRSDLFLLYSHPSLSEWEHSLCAITSGRRTQLWLYRKALLKFALSFKRDITTRGALARQASRYICDVYRWVSLEIWAAPCVG